MTGARILVVEDEPLLALDMQSVLGDASFELVGPAGTPEAALDLIADRGCDAALLDVNLRGSPVTPVAAELVRRGIPFAFVTGYGREGLPKRFARAPVVEKPFDNEELVEVVHSLVRQAGTSGAGASDST